ncbi:hypothetical protein B0H17DRAFT_1037047 [Mycena rosella]|uniref:Uncharacterized protein n=1 Tax=Mycena rosella TaxID=1033263 RepID=A0AAD7M955_MYCRO|nr:hypothetical protein B0H17DRAFT_1037047 [Mycena rosella]
MASSVRLTKHHRRSHSASSSPIPRRSPGDSWRVATKRAHPQPFGSASPDLSSPQKWDVDLWRRGKRRRRNISVSIVVPSAFRFSCPTQSESDSMDVDFGRPTFHSSPIPAAPPTPAFAATPAEFHLFSKNPRTTDRKRRATHHAESALDLDFHPSGVPESRSPSSSMRALSQLRSDAFSQLHRSVAENGEGFVKSMRVYETRRSRTTALKVKEAQRRGRRRSPAHSPAAVHMRDDSGEDGDDDVQIFAGEPTNTSFTGRGKQRAFSVGVVEEKPHHSAVFLRSDRCSSPGATCDSSSSIYLSDDDVFAIRPTTQLSPALSHTLSDSANSSLISLNLPPPFAPKAILPSRAEKAIAALSLAMANGAGGLEDYEALRRLHTFSPDNCEVGEMWH